MPQLDLLILYNQTVWTIFVFCLIYIINLLLLLPIVRGQIYVKMLINAKHLERFTGYLRAIK
jgi:hypothetical protein